jgi:alpha-glucosidase
MPWEAEAVQCGFSSVEPWLPIPDAHVPLSVDRQHVVPGSTLNRLRRFLAWRRTVPALRRGTIEFLDMDPPVLAFERALGAERVLCVFNLGAEETGVHLPQHLLGTECEGHGFGATQAAGKLRLPAWGAWFGARE